MTIAVLQTITMSYSICVNNNSTICEYCQILKPGYLLLFYNVDQYQRHIVKNHTGLPLQPTKGELDRFKKTVPPYEEKLRRNIRRELWRMTKYDRINHVLNDDYHPPERYQYLQQQPQSEY